MNVKREKRAGRSKEVYGPRRRENKNLLQNMDYVCKSEALVFLTKWFTHMPVAFSVGVRPPAAIDQQNKIYIRNIFDHYWLL